MASLVYEREIGCVDRTTVCIVRDVIATSWRKETKYTASTHGTELEKGNQEEKTLNYGHDEGKQ